MVHFLEDSAIFGKSFKIAARLRPCANDRKTDVEEHL